MRNRRSTTRTLLAKIQRHAQLWTAGAVLAGCILAAQLAYAQNGELYLSPFAVSQQPQVEFQVQVIADGGVPPISCFAVTLDYDHNLLELVSATEGTLFSASGIPSFFSVDTDTQGRDVLTDCVLGFGTSVVPSGILATLTFQGLTSGVTSVQPVDVVLRDVDRAVISGIAIAGTTVSLGSVGTTATIPQTKLRMSVDPNPATGPVRIAVLGLRAAAEESSAGSPQAHAADGAPSSESIEIVIHDIAGRSVRTLLVSSASPQVYWDGLDASGQRVARGVYFVVGTTPDGQRALAKVVRLD